MKGHFISTDIRYRNGLAMVESVDKVENIESVDSVIDNNMDISGVGDAGGGEDIGNLYETLEKIVEGAKSSAASNTEDDVSLNDILDMIGEGGKQSVSAEAEPDDVAITAVNEVRIEGGGVSVDESRDVGGDETKSVSEVTNNSAPTNGDSASDDSVVNVDNSIETDKADGDINESVNSNVSGSVGGDVKNVCESECSGETVSAIPPIPKYRLREIFRYAEGECINIAL